MTENREKKGLFARLREGMTKTRESITHAIDQLTGVYKELDDDFYDDLEAVLIGADIGVKTTEEIIARFRADPLLDGITLTGGDPFCQPAACAVLARAARESGLNVWAYTGYLYEETLGDPAMRALLEAVDVLIDGPFVLAERTLSLRFRGSKNQRAIDVPASLKSGAVVEKDI